MLDEIVYDDFSAHEYKTRIRLTNEGGIFLPSENGEDSLECVLKNVTVGDFDAVHLRFRGQDEEDERIAYFVNRQLLSVDGYVFSRDSHGWMKESDFIYLMKKVNPMIIMSIFSKIEESMNLPKEEEDILIRQAGTLAHAKTIGGFIHKILRLYHEQSILADEFGFGGIKIENMLYRDYQGLKKVREMSKQENAPAGNSNKGRFTR